MASASPKQYFDQLNDDYLAIHRAKEDLFWTTYMATSDSLDESAKTNTAWSDFVSNADRIGEINHQLKLLSEQADSPERQQTEHGLKGWLASFECNALSSEQAQQQKAVLIKIEANLFERRQKYEMTFVDEKGETQAASPPLLAANVSTHNNEQVRLSSFQALLDLEHWVLDNGFLDLVRERNKLAKLLGHENYFEYFVQKTEHMNGDELFEILDDFELRTRDNYFASLQKLKSHQGEEALKAHNFNFFTSGDAQRDLDPYLPFSKSLRRWVESFGRLKVDYSQAELTLDLLERQGKYQNGFCHAPITAYMDNGQWVASKVNFTCIAAPDQVGSGIQGINTLFHEGGHAAHFANIKQNSPCFSSEFPPTSMAYAETQSMFLDSLIQDADWLKTYASNKAGEIIPDAVIKGLIDSSQDFRAYEERRILIVPNFERALYSLDEKDLNPEYVLKLARKIEVDILGLEQSPRPLMAIPHLLSGESACSYHGYLMANMAVYQTRAYFESTLGYLADNPAIGPLLSEHYWKPGNSISHDQTIRNLTGEGFNAKYLADVCNLSVQQAWDIELQKMEKLKSRKQAEIEPLNASIPIVDGDQLLASNKNSNAEMCDQFEASIFERFGV